MITNHGLNYRSLTVSYLIALVTYKKYIRNILTSQLNLTFLKNKFNSIKYFYKTFVFTVVKKISKFQILPKFCSKVIKINIYLILTSIFLSGLEILIINRFERLCTAILRVCCFFFSCTIKLLDSFK